MNGTVKNRSPTIEIVGGNIEVTGQLDGGSLINGIWRTLFTGTLAQDADHFIDRAHVLLQRHLNMLPPEDHDNIWDSLDLARDMKDTMEKQRGISQIQKNIRARKYKRRARKTYKLVKSTSARAFENFLRSQVQRPPPPENGGLDAGHGTTAPDPLDNAHARVVSSRVDDINVNNVVQVDVSAYQDEATNEGAAVIDAIGRDGSVQYVVAFTGDRTDMGGEMSTMHKHFLAPTTSRSASQPTASGLG